MACDGHECGPAFLLLGIWEDDTFPPHLKLGNACMTHLANNMERMRHLSLLVGNFKSQYTSLPPAMGIMEIVLRWGPCQPESLSDKYEQNPPADSQKN